MSEVKMRVVHRGQIQPYSDTYNVWEVETDMPEEEVLKWCQREILSSRYVPSQKEWESRQAKESLEYYFRGFYNLVKFKEGVWRFTRVMPYTD